MTNIVVPNDVKSIGEGAFTSCSSLTSLNVPAAVTEIGAAIAVGCSSLSSITVAVGNTKYKSEGDCLIEIASNKLISGCKSSTIPSYVAIIGKGAFNEIPITYIEIPANVTTIERDAFWACEYLEEVEIEAGSQLSSIATFAFRACITLKTIWLPNTVTTIEQVAFGSNFDLTIYAEAWSKPSGWHNDWSYRNNPVWWGMQHGVRFEVQGGVAVLTEYTGNASTLIIPDQVIYGSTTYDVAKISESACINRTNLQSVYIPISVKSIGWAAFAGCSNLLHIAIPFVGNAYGMPVNAYFGYIFGGANSAVPSSLKTVEITYNDNIKNGAFSGCTSIEQIYLSGQYMMSIDDYAFSGCTSLWYFQFPWRSYISSIGDYAFAGCESLESIVLPDALTEIGDNAFSGCSSLAYVSMTATGIVSIGDYTFYNCTTLSEIMIPANVESIGERAFAGCNSLVSIMLPASLESIGEWAFYGCSGLETVYAERYEASPVPPATQITALGANVFYGCGSLTEVIVPHAALSAYTNAWTSTSNWPSGASIVAVAPPFTATDGLKLTKSGNAYVVSKGTANTNGVVYIPAYYNGLPVTEIASDAFKNCTGLTEVVLEPGSMLAIVGTSAFSGCTNLTSINLPDSLEEIKENAFNNTGFFAAAPADGVVYAGKNVIYGAGGAATFAGGSGGWAVGVKGTVSGTVTVAPGTKGLIMRAFYNKTAITGMVLPSSLRYIGERSLEKISITQITIPEGVVYVGSRAFQSVTTLQTVSVPATVDLMRGYSFDGCTSLSTVYINRPSALGVTAIQVSTFNNCTSLAHLYVPDDSASEAAYKTATNWKSYAAKISVEP